MGCEANFLKLGRGTIGDAGGSLGELACGNMGRETLILTGGELLWR